MPDPIITPEGISVEFVGATMHLRLPEGMTTAEALVRLQLYFDHANAATGADIQMLLPEENHG